METVLCEVVGKIAKITFNRPEALNALNKKMLEQLHEVIDEIKNNEIIKYVIFTGSGKAFIAGADITEMADMDEDTAKEYAILGSSLFRKIEKLEKITIALINGYCLGGGNELAMSCDYRIAFNKAKFGQPEVSLGITPGFSGTVRLPLLVGLSKARDLLYTGRIISADEALAIGLITSVTEDLASSCESLIETLENNSFNALIAIKKLLDVEIDRAIALENSVFSQCFNHQHQKEGMKAFIEKRKPKYE